MRNLTAIFVCVACLCTSGSAYFITVDADAEECFFDKVDTGSKLSLSYQIAEGAFLDIDVRIVGPDNEIIYRVYRKTSGKSTFTAYTPGVYTYCFSNKMFPMTPKVVMFDMVIGKPRKSNMNQDFSAGTVGESDKKLKDMFHELSDTLTGVKLEMKYMQVRERIHRAINESTKESTISNVVVGSLFEALIMVTITFSQVYYLKRLFEVQCEV